MLGQMQPVIHALEESNLCALSSEDDMCLTSPSLSLSLSSSYKPSIAQNDMAYVPARKIKGIFLV
jgi:hypothetical protein